MLNINYLVYFHWVTSKSLTSGNVIIIVKTSLGCESFFLRETSNFSYLKHSENVFQKQCKKKSKASFAKKKGAIKVIRVFWKLFYFHLKYIHVYMMYDQYILSKMWQDFVNCIFGTQKNLKFISSTCTNKDSFITLHTCKMICFHILKRMVIIYVIIIVNCDGQRWLKDHVSAQLYVLCTDSYCSWLFLFWIQILGEERFRCIEKIKTIGYTYMGASGLTPETNYSDMSHVVAMAEFAFSIRDLLQNVNQHSFNNFKMRVGKRKF